MVEMYSWLVIWHYSGGILLWWKYSVCALVAVVLQPAASVQMSGSGLPLLLNTVLPDLLEAISIAFLYG